MRPRADVKAPARAIAGMPRSGIREVMELASLREGVLHLEVGEPDFQTPGHIVEAAARAAAEGYTKYTPNRGLPSVVEAICEKLARRNGIVVEPDQVVVTAGAVGAIMGALIALVEPGEEILLPDPGWPNYEMMAAVIGARTIAYPLDRAQGYEPDLDRLAELAARPRAKAIVVNSPGNPTGAVWSRETFARVVEIARDSGLYVVSDEVYEEIVFEGEHVSPATFDEDGRVVTASGVSKTYAMTGWRIGYLAAHAEVAGLVAKVQEPLVACAAAVSQRAAEAALRGPQDCVSTMRDAYRRRRDTAVDALREHGLLVSEPRGAFYILADVGRATDDTYAFARALVAEHAVAVAPGATFGPAGRALVRLSLASASEVIEEGIARLATAVELWSEARHGSMGA
jgi:aspartate/methionine/tyrosine aminotransferase